ncbi:hypothetical protein EE612_047490, partial [Oryza sativa]
SAEEHGAPVQDTPTDTNTKNLQVDQNVTDKLVRISLMHGYVPSMRNHDEFSEFVASLNPKVELPSDVDLYLYFTRLFEEEKANLKKQFESSNSRVSLSVYVWHYDTHSPYLCLSVHYIDDQWESKRKIIAFRVVDSSCNAKELIKVILIAIKDWGLLGKVFSIALDDTFIDNSVASDVKDILQKWNLRHADQSLSGNQSLFVVRYATHLLDQVIQVGLNELDKIMEKSRKFSKLDKFMEKSRKFSSYPKGPAPLALQYPNHRYAPSSEDWVKAENICEILDDFHKQKDEIPKHHSPLKLFDTIWHVKNVVHRKLLYHDDKETTYVWEKMQEQFKEQWKVCCLHICMPMIIDPKYRLEIIKSHIPLDLDNDMIDYIEEVNDILLRLFHEYSGQVEDPNCTSSSETSGGHSLYPDDKLVFHYLGSEFPQWWRPMTELDQYLQDPCLSNDRIDVLRWWKEHSMIYPTISRIARDILAIPYGADYEVATRTAKLALVESDGSHFVEELVCTQDLLRSGGKFVPLLFSIAIQLHYCTNCCIHVLVGYANRVVIR